MRLSAFHIVVALAVVVAFFTSPPDPATHLMLWLLDSIVGCIAVVLYPRAKQ